MNQKHVPDREHCQELDRLCKEKGIVVPETEYTWYRKSYTDEYRLLAKDGYDSSMYEAEGWIKTFPAPLVSEQGECLPQRIAKNKGQQIWALQCFKKMHNGKEEWFTRYENVEGTGFLNMQDPTEANARQKMLNYLIAEGIITKL